MLATYPPLMAVSTIGIMIPPLMAVLTCFKYTNAYIILYIYTNHDESFHDDDDDDGLGAPHFSASQGSPPRRRTPLRTHLLKFLLNILSRLANSPRLRFGWIRGVWGLGVVKKEWSKGKKERKEL